MSPTPKAAMSEDAAAASRTLASLHEEADRLRAEVAELRRALAQAKQEFSDTRAGQLLQANEQLVIAALRAETFAETAVNSLDELSRSSQLDVLTGTPNRALMMDRLHKALALARRNKARVAVLFLDLDAFKQINDELGHAAGDEVLNVVARRLESVVRDADTVSRQGGDEFLVLLSEISHAADAELIAGKILCALAQPMQVRGKVLRIAASVGIAVYPEHGEAATTLIERADAAMYRAKRRGRGCFEFHQA